ncbi:MAG TPA: metalloenzyme [Roseiflexaceae bacterium]|nr:metalloenzyme [Roseiflexaceae bacterium]
MRIVFVFVDGIGLAPVGADNPLGSAAMPFTAGLLGGPLTSEQTQQRPNMLFKPIDATLGVPGLPQSGTGHVALLAGFNAPAEHGRHQPHVPPVALRERLANDNIYHRAQRAGKQAAFANVFGPNYWRALETRRVRRSASVIAAEGAGVRLRTVEDFQRGEAVAWDITAEALHGREPNIPMVTARDAGLALARLAAQHDVVFFETFLPDLAAHGRLAGWGQNSRAEALTPAVIIPQIHDAMARIDGLLAGAIPALPPDTTLILTSDHGNAESLASPTHTRNPVPLLAIGPGSARFALVESIAEVADAIEAVLIAQRT